MDHVSSTPLSSFGLTPYRLGKPNLKEAVADMIRELIYSGRLRPGERIDQKEIAAALGVSKLPVREALITLESEGLVENVPRHGAFVAALSPSDVRDHYLVYGMVAGLAAEMTASMIDEADLTALEELVAASESTSDPNELERLNFSFHQCINRVGSSRRLRVSLNNLAKGLPPRFYANNPGWSEIALADHREILAALRAREGGAARRAMETHLRKAADYAVKSLEAHAFWGEGVDGTGGESDAGHGLSGPRLTR